MVNLFPFSLRMAFFLACSLLSVATFSASREVLIEEAPEKGALYPVDSQILTGTDNGKKFISIQNAVGPSLTAQSNPVFNAVNSAPQEWSYSRGVGTIPNACPQGFSGAGLLCYEYCPDGYDTVAGVCWQHCPDGFTDHGATCTKWKFWPETIAKRSFLQKIKSMNCSDSKVEEAGLCYSSCAPTFVGVGPLCFGLLGNADDQDYIREEAQFQHEQAEALTTNGIVLNDEQTPSLRTDVSFNPIVCGIDLSGTDNQLNNGIDELLDPLDLGAWINASLSGTVLLDFNFDATCERDGLLWKGALSFHPSVTAKVNSKMFDPALHNLAGVDLGVMNVSVYELIPFRIYGTVGADVGMEAKLTSTIDLSKPPLIIDDVRHAHVTRLDVMPKQDLWLTVDAYLRITSIFDFIPDLVQLGSEVNVHVLETSLPYSLEEGVRDYAGAYELYKEENLTGTVAAGRGYIDTYLRILGNESETFGNDADLQWPGEQVSETFIDTHLVTPIEL